MSGCKHEKELVGFCHGFTIYCAPCIWYCAICDCEWRSNMFTPWILHEILSTEEQHCIRFPSLRSGALHSGGEE